jgi:iron complex outermembrane recepter protein
MSTKRGSSLAAAVIFAVFWLAVPNEIGAQSSDRDVMQLEPVTVTATKTAVEPETVPFTYHEVGREEIEAQPEFYINNVGELVRDVPGVHVGQYYPWGPPWIHLRGTGYFIGRTVYLVDGLPIWSFMSTTLNPHDIQRADVLLGPSSALYGANASGGAVNFITRSGEAGMGAKAELAYGTNSTFRPHASVGDKTDHFSYYLSYSGDYSDGYRMKPVKDMVELWELGKKQYLSDASLEDNEYEHSYLAGKVAYENDSGFLIWAGVNYARRYLYGGQENLILDDDGDQAITTAGFEVPLGTFGRLKWTGAYQYYDHPQQYNQGLSLVDGQVVLDPTEVRRRDWTVKRTPVELQTDFFLGDSNTLTAGLFWSREEEERVDLWTATGRESVYEVTTDQTAFYLQDQLLLMEDRLSLVAGLRYDEWEYKDIFVTSADPQRPDSVSKDTWTYRGGAKYRVNETVAVRSSVGTAYWPGLPLWFFQNITTGKTWREANPDLQPEETWMADLGVDLSFDRFGTWFGITGYYGEIEDMVSYRYDENPDLEGGTIIRTLNLGGAEIYGVEFSLRQRLTDQLWLTGALTLNHSEIVDDPNNEGNQLRNAPDYWGSIGLKYVNPALINASLLIRFSDDRYYDDDNTELPFFHMSSYETVDLKVWRDWEIQKDLFLNTTISAVNLFDEEYETEIVYVNPGLYLEGMIGLKYVF